MLDFNLWIKGKQSDLTATIEMKEINGQIEAVVYDLHVL